MQSGLIRVKSVDEAIDNHYSYRSYLAMLRFLDEELNRASRTDWQLMRLAREVRMGWLKDPSTAPSTEQFQVTFNIDPQECYLSERELKEQHAQMSMDNWGGILRSIKTMNEKGKK